MYICMATKNSKMDGFAFTRVFSKISLLLCVYLLMFVSGEDETPTPITMNSSPSSTVTSTETEISSKTTSVSTPSTTAAIETSEETQTTYSSPTLTTSTPITTPISTPTPTLITTPTQTPITTPTPTPITTTDSTSPSVWCSRSDECRPTWYCIMSRCHCLMGHISNGTHCITPGSSGEPCNNLGQCIQGASCVNSICVCLEPFYNTSNGECLERVRLGEACSLSSQCMRNAECTNSSCVCKQGYLPLNNTCSIRLLPGEGECEVAENCVTRAFCNNQSVCQCEDGFFAMNGKCDSVELLKPQNVQVTDYGSRSITVMWTQPGVCSSLNCEFIVSYITATGSRHSNSTNLTTVQLTGLEPGETYHITVKTLLTDNNGQEILSRGVEILMTTMKSQAENLTVVPGDRYVNVTFDEPVNETNRLFHLSVNNAEDSTSYCVALYRNVPSCQGENSTKLNEGFRCNKSIPIGNDEKRVKHTVTDLKPYTNYRVTVVMVKCVNNKPIISGPANSHIRTLPTVPGPVRNITTSLNESHVCVMWNSPKEDSGPLHYEYRFQDIVNNQTDIKRNTTNEEICEPEAKLSGFWEYRVEVKVMTSAGGSEGRESDTFITRKRDPILKVQATNADGMSCTDTDSGNKHGNYRSIVLIWKDPSPEDRGTRLTKYQITVNNSPETIDENLKESLTSANDSVYRRTQSGSHNINVTVVPGQQYKFEFKTFDNESMVVWNKSFTCNAPIGVPPEWDSSSPTIASASTKTLTVFFPDRNFFSNNLNGEITGKYIIVGQGPLYIQGCQIKLEAMNYPTWRPETFSHLINVTEKTISGLYTLGTERNCGGFCNAELKPSTVYYVKAVVCTLKGCVCSPLFGPFRTTKEKDYTTWIGVGVVSVALVLAVALVIAALLWKYKKSENPSIHLPLSIRRGMDYSKIPRARPIMLANIDAEVAEMHSDSNRIFSMHYEDIVRISPRRSTAAANLDDNKQKNRWVNVLPFDESRVKLSVIDNEETSDYINASYLPGYNWDKEYIASQGPLPGTVDDFWRMIWEQKVSLIVMVTPIKENGKVKCEEYWPVDNQEPKQYGNIVVENISFSSLNTYNVTIFQLRICDSETEELRTVKHFHFLNWKDMSANVERNDIINFVRTVRSYVRPDMEGPIVVHCSAGVGRTGTFICVDYLIQYIENHSLDETIDIYAYILKLRDHRVLMVQTESQYIFIHDCAQQLVEEKRVALDNISDDELYVNTQECVLETEEEEKCLIYENADMTSTSRLVQQTEL